MHAIITAHWAGGKTIPKAVCFADWLHSIPREAITELFPFCYLLLLTLSHALFSSLFQAWADAFRSSPDLTGVVQVYEELKRKGIEFPTSDLETLSPIHTPQRVGGPGSLTQNPKCRFIFLCLELFYYWRKCRFAMLNTQKPLLLISRQQRTLHQPFSTGK